MKLFLVFAAVSTLFAQSSAPIRYRAENLTAPKTMEAQTVPATPTVVTTSNLIFSGGWISCTSARTVTLTDGNAVDILPAVAVAANQIVSLSVISGAYVSGGFSISASGAGCKYSAWWRQ